MAIRSRSNSGREVTDVEKKKYFISADIEGVTDVTSWEECHQGGAGYPEACRQMSLEVAAACEAILEAGHEVVVRDGHGSAKNIIHRVFHLTSTNI